jgi:hypothetical protein
METIPIVIAGAAIVGAIIIAIVQATKKRKKNASSGDVNIGLAPMVASPKPPHSATEYHAPAPVRNRNRRNKRGWRAPAGHYFDDDDQLHTDAGDLILDMIMIAQLCGEQHDPDAVLGHESHEIPVEAVGSETIASRPVESEVSPSTSFSDLQTAEETTRHEPAPSYSDPEPSYGGGDSYDSGGDSGGGGGDD